MSATTNQQSPLLHEEAVKLAQAAITWARGALAIDPTEPDAETCVGCPVCRLTRQLRHDDGQLAHQWGDAIADLAGTLATMLQPLTAPPDPIKPDRPEEGPSDETTPDTTQERIQRVTVTGRHG